jgi:hypothetical protein
MSAEVRNNVIGLELKNAMDVKTKLYNDLLSQKNKKEKEIQNPFRRINN